MNVGQRAQLLTPRGPKRIVKSDLRLSPGVAVPSESEEEPRRMIRSVPLRKLLLLTAVFALALPVVVTADEIVLFKNGKTLRADELVEENGVYRITTMSGGVMQIPVQLVDRVISCSVDHDVKEERGTAPAGRPGGQARAGRSSVTKIPPAGAGARGKSPMGGRLGGAGGAAGKAPATIPPKGGMGGRVRVPPGGEKGGKK